METSQIKPALWGAVGGDPGYPVEPGALYSGSVVARFAAPRRGVFGAINLTTNRIAWRQQWVDQCYSGSIVTAGVAIEPDFSMIALAARRAL